MLKSSKFLQIAMHGYGFIKKKNLAVFDVYKQIMKPKLLSQVNTDQFLCFMFIGL